MKPFIIAEIGVNHNGSIELAKKLILEAYLSGADAVKFQTFKSESVVSKNTSLAEYQKNFSEEKDQYDLIKKLELSKTDFIYLKKYCDLFGIEFLSTPFDEDSLNFLIKDLGVKKIKLSSCDLTNISLLWKASTFNIPLIISTGMSTIDDIEIALSIIIHARKVKKYPKDLNDCLRFYIENDSYKEYLKDVTLLHCSTAYPCPIEYINLNAMVTLKKKFNLTVGYSDHSIGKEVCIAATSLGASILEKHFTLNVDMQGPDHQASMEPRDFSEMVKSIRITEKALGSSEKYINEVEIENCQIAKRSVFARRKIKKGNLIQYDDLIALRPEIKEAIPARNFFDILGKKSDKDINAGDFIPIEMIMEN